VEAIIGFLGSAAFRYIFGWVSDFFTKKQDHVQEMARMRLQAQLDADAASRELLRLKTVTELGIKQIQVQSEADLNKIDAQGFALATVEAIKPIGIKVIDAWNGAIRPAAATISLAIWVGSIISRNFVINEFDVTMLGVVLGFYFANRSLSKEHK
jgi:hypothetical protein